MCGTLRFGAWVLLSICIGISLWMLGYQSALAYILNINPSNGQALSANGNPVYNGAPFEMTNFAQRIGQLFSSTQEITQLIAVAALVIGLSALTGFSSMYFIPIILLIFITNYVAMPISSEVLNMNCSNIANQYGCVNQPGGVPAFIYWPLLLLLNTMCVMACVSFIRGGV